MSPEIHAQKEVTFSDIQQIGFGQKNFDQTPKKSISNLKKKTGFYLNCFSFHQLQ